MNAKIITVWGAAGSGKSTVASGLSMAIAERNCMVGLISSNLSCGELQSLFGRNVEESKGIYRAISNHCNTKNMFAETGHPNLFILSPPNSFDGMLLTAVSGDTARELLEDSAMRFDYVIIDGSCELNNPISGMGLMMSDEIISVYRVSARCCLWYRAMENVSALLHLREKTIRVVNGYDKTCDKMVFLNSLNMKPDFELPYVANADVLINSGKTLYQSHSGLYKKMMQRLACQVMLGG